MPTDLSRHRKGSLATRLLPVQLDLGALILAGNVSAQAPDTLPSPGALKNMSLEQLMAIEVSSIPRLQISVVGQNLLHARHEEFGAAASAQSIERGVFAKAMWGF